MEKGSALQMIEMCRGMFRKSFLISDWKANEDKKKSMIDIISLSKKCEFDLTRFFPSDCTNGQYFSLFDFCDQRSKKKKKSVKRQKTKKKKIIIVSNRGSFLLALVNFFTTVFCYDIIIKKLAVIVTT